MDATLMYLLGFLDEKMWMQSLRHADGKMSKDRVKAFAKDVYDYYSWLGWSEKTMRQLDLIASEPTGGLYL